MDDRDATRREVLAGSAAAVAALSLGPAAAHAADDAAHATVTGTVFEDRSGRGQRQPDDPGLAGVLVSNGRDVVKTDADGRYSLPVEDGTAIFVVKPTSFAVPLDANNLPRFAYIYQPAGTPADLKLRYRGIDPTGPLPASIDFPLRRASEPSTFDVVLFTDPQPESERELDFVRDAVIEAVVGTKAAFGMTTGDIMFDDLSLFERYNRMIGQIGVPWYHIGGNHDLNYEAPDRGFSRETFKRHYGAPYYAFEYGSALFVMLDNVDYLGANPSRPYGAGNYEGRIGERQLAFLGNLLAATPPDRLVVIAMHIPLRTYLEPNAPSVNTTDREDFLKLLGNRKAVSFSGHTHTTEHHYFGPADGMTGPEPHHHHVMTAVCGSWWSGPLDKRGIAVADSRDGTPNGYHVLSIDGDRYSTRFVAPNEPNARQMRIMLESQFHQDRPELLHEYPIERLLGSPISAESAGAANLVVNFFDGGPKTTLTYRIGQREPVAMERVRRPDPFVREIFARNRAITKPWVKAEPSAHIWVARLPADLKAGTHRIEVDAVDEYGRSHSDNMLVEVTGSAASRAKAPT